MKILITIGIIILTVWAFDYAISRHEESQCETYRSWAEEYEGFYLTQWQKEMCDIYGIEINAEIK